MVSGKVSDPVLNLDNAEIVRRHCFALLMSLFQQDEVPDTLAGGVQSAGIFENLGLLSDFRRERRVLYRRLEAWLSERSDDMRTNSRHRTKRAARGARRLHRGAA